MVRFNNCQDYAHALKWSTFISDEDRLLIPCLSGRKEENFIDNLREIDPGEPLMRISCLIRRLTKRWNSRRTWKICYVFNFQLKKIRSKIIQITLIELWSFISFELRHLNSMKMSQKAKFGCSIFQLKIKRKQIFQVRHQFGHFVKCRIWHELHISLNKWKKKYEVFIKPLISEWNCSQFSDSKGKVRFH